MPTSTIDNGFPNESQRYSRGSDTLVHPDHILFNAQTHRPAIPNYEVMDELGRGGMGVVYRARDLRLKRHVAIKMLLDPEFASPEQRMRFKIEAEAVAQLRHPNIVQVYELGELTGSSIAHPYMVLEYVDGPTLFRYMRQRTFTERETAALMITLARAIQHAHDHGLIHRDLKPANILLHQDPVPDSGIVEMNGVLDFTPKITDFGLVKALVYDGEVRRDLTRPELMVGTPQYMAPEQANPAPNALSCSVDIYSLGVIFYELLTGRLPFDDLDILKMLMEVQTQDPLSPLKVKPGISVDLATICMKCLNKAPEQRYASAAALADDLSRFLNHEPIQARPLSEWQKTVKWVRRHPLVAGLVTLLFSVVTIALIVIGILWRRAEGDRLTAQIESQEASWARDEARLAEQVARKTEAEAKRQEQAAQRSLYFSRVAQADLLLQQGLLARPLNILNTANRMIRDEDPRGWEWYYLRQQCNTMESVNIQSKDYVQQVHFHPKKDILLSIEGAEYFAGDEPSAFPARLLLHRADGDKDRQSYKTAFVSPFPLRHLFLLKEGEYAIVVDSKQQLTLINVNEALQGISKSWKLPQFPHHAIASEAGLAMQWKEQGESLELFDVEKKLLKDSLKLPGAVQLACISSDGQRILFSLKNKDLVCWDRKQGKAIWKKQLMAPARQLLLNSNGSELVCLDESDTVRWEQVERGQTLYQGQFRYYSHACLSADSKALAIIARGEGDDIHVYRKGADGQVRPIPYVLHEHRGTIRNMTFSPNGKQLLSFGSDAIVRLWDVGDPSGSSGSILHRFSGHLAQVQSAAFSPRSNVIASGGIDANIMFWRTDVSISGDRRFMAELECGGEWISDYRFVQDTPWLAVFQHQQTKLVLLDMNTRQVVRKIILPEATNEFRAPRYDVHFSPDGKQLAILNKLHNQVLIYDTLQGTLLWKTPTSGFRFYWLAFSGDGNRILAAGHVPNPATPGKPVPFLSGFQVWDVAARKMLVEEKVEGFSNSWAINYDGTRLASALRTREHSLLTLYSVDGGVNELWRMPNNYRFLSSLAFSPDGQSVAGVNFDPTHNELALWSVNTGELRWKHNSIEEPTQVTFTRDSKRILTIGYSSDIIMHDSQTGREVLSFRSHGIPRLNDYSLSPRIVFNHDETMLAAHSWEGTLSFWHAFNKEAYERNPKTFEKTRVLKWDISDE